MVRALLVSLSTLALVGCSSHVPIAEPTPSPTVEPSPSEQSPADAWDEALAATSGAISVDVQLVTDVEGFQRTVAGTGYVDLDSDFGDITWTDDLATTREIMSGSGHFLELEGTWFELDPSTPVPTKVGFTPLSGLNTATNVTREGEETVLGSTATRFDAQLDAPLAPIVMGFSEEERTVVDESSEPTLVATIWVGPDGRVVRLLREYTAISPDGDPISATSVILLSPAEPRPIDVPETADAIPAPA